MGHSTVTIQRNGMLNASEVRAVVENKKEEDKYEYGHGENADSWVNADSPRAKNTSLIFSESAAWDIINNIGSYESIYLYYVPDTVWKKHFSSNESKIAKTKLKLKTLESDLKTVSDDALNNSNVKLWLEQKTTDENIFISCSDCKSKLHAPSYLWANKRLPDRCPVCKAENADFSNQWRESLYGKRYVSKRAKIEAEIKELKEEISKLDSCDVTELTISELDKKENQDLRDAAQTFIAADIHH
jgi:hypothetical protein